MLRYTYIAFLFVSILHVKMGRWLSSYLNNVIQIFFGFMSSQVSFRKYENCCSSKIIVLFYYHHHLHHGICYLFISN